MEKKSVHMSFLAEPSTVNFGGKVHGGEVMKWIDQAGYANAVQWSGFYSVTVYVGGIRFLAPIRIGSFVDVTSELIYTGNSSMHLNVEVRSRSIKSEKSQLCCHCVIVFAAVDETGQTVNVSKFTPQSQREKDLEAYALDLMEMRKGIQDKMGSFYNK